MLTADGTVSFEVEEESCDVPMEGVFDFLKEVLILLIAVIVNLIVAVEFVVLIDIYG